MFFADATALGIFKTNAIKDKDKYEVQFKRQQQQICNTIQNTSTTYMEHNSKHKNDKYVIQFKR